MTVELLADLLDAHGGLDNWNRVDSLSAQLVLGGPFWSMVGWPEAEPRPTATLDARREHITLAPFGAPDRTSIFDVDPERLTIQTAAGQIWCHPPFLDRCQDVAWALSPTDRISARLPEGVELRLPTPDASRIPG